MENTQFRTEPFTPRSIVAVHQWQDVRKASGDRYGLTEHNDGTVQLWYSAGQDDGPELTAEQLAQALTELSADPIITFVITESDKGGRVSFSLYRVVDGHMLTCHSFAYDYNPARREAGGAESLLVETTTMEPVGGQQLAQ